MSPHVQAYLPVLPCLAAATHHFDAGADADLLRGHAQQSICGHKGAAEEGDHEHGLAGHNPPLAHLEIRHIAEKGEDGHLQVQAKGKRRARRGQEPMDTRTENRGCSHTLRVAERQRDKRDRDRIPAHSITKADKQRAVSCGARETERTRGDAPRRR